MEIYVLLTAIHWKIGENDFWVDFYEPFDIRYANSSLSLPRVPVHGFYDAGSSYVYVTSNIVDMNLWYI